MTEYINKEELIKACNYTVCYDDEDDEETFGISEARIDLMPTIDIVQCGECVYWCGEDEEGGDCHDSADWFCADAIRKE